MDQDQFWEMIAAARAEAGPDNEQMVERLTQALAALSEAEIVAFQRVLDERMAESYTNPLWAAGYVINGGCSDDLFDYFRGWLIAHGRAIYEAALADPGTLAEAPNLVIDPDEEDATCESMLYVAAHAFKRKTGQDMKYPARSAWVLTGPEWDEETVNELYPGLEARFWPED